MYEKNSPLVTVVISTRNRGKSVTKTVQSILLNDYPHFSVIIVDQSDDDVTKTALQAFLPNPRIQYIRTKTVGLSTGRNMGIRAAKSAFIAITDDDCEAQANWIRELVTAFALNNRIGIVFGNVRPVVHKPAMGFVTAYMRTEPFLARSMWEKHQVEGISGCMGLRRSVWETLGGFDQLLGLGAPLKSAEESDITIRALLAGYFVYETPDVTVVHKGFCRLEHEDALLYRNWYGTGAMFVKHLKCRHYTIIYLLIRLAWRWTFWRSRVAKSLGIRPHRLLRLVSFIHGFLTGATIPVDRTNSRFMDRNTYR